MTSHSRTIISPSDRIVRDLFVKLENRLGTETTFAIAGFANGIKSGDEKLIKLIKTEANIISSANIQSVGFNIAYNARQVYSNSQGHNIQHPFYSAITINVNDGYGQQTPPDPDVVADCQVLIGQFIKRNGLDSGVLGNENTEILDQHLALLSKIESSAADQINKTNEFVRDLTLRFDDRAQDLEKQFETRRKKLEFDIECKLDALKNEEEALEARKKFLDDRTNTHARRAIREDLIMVLKDRQEVFSVSSDTRKLRGPVHIVFITLLVATLSGAIWSLYVWGTGGNDTWGAITVTSAAKTSIFSFGFLTSAGLYISWMTRWSDKHADAQFQLRQFEIDINRASWSVEAALEWKGAQGEQMPDALLVGITKHLFENSTSEVTEYSPLEALATSILGSASNLKLNLNGSEVAYDRKTLKEIKKAST